MRTHAGLSLCLSHIPHFWKSRVVTRIWTSLLLFREKLRPALTDLFCFGATSTGATSTSTGATSTVVDQYSQTKF